MARSVRQRWSSKQRFELNGIEGRGHRAFDRQERIIIPAEVGMYRRRRRMWC
jgi:hypothetical protein